MVIKFRNLQLIKYNIFKKLQTEFLLIVERERERERVSLTGCNYVGANACKALGFDILKLNNNDLKVVI